MKRIFMSWSSFSSRSDLLAKTFNAKSYHVSHLMKKTLVHTISRYIISFFHTFFILLHEKPDVIFIINLPVFLPIAVYIYSKFKKSHYVIDSHSGLFNIKIWKLFIPIMKFIYRESLLVISHNKHDDDIYKSWGVKTLILGTELYSNDNYKMVNLRTSNNIVVIAVFASDEPIQEVLLAALNLPQVHFYITGPIENARRSGITQWPENVILTDFIPRDEFVGLVMAADAAMVLVTTNNTMQMGAWEAMSWGTPLILSDWELLRETFTKGAVFVRNTAADIKAGVEKLFENRERLIEEIKELRNEKIVSWNREVEAVWKEIEGVAVQRPSL